MKTVCKKLLCLMLVAMMLVSAVPYAFADDAVVEEPVNVPVSVTLDGDVINSSKTLTVNPGESLVLDEAAAMAQLRDQEGRAFESWSNSNGETVTGNALPYEWVKEQADYSLTINLVSTNNDPSEEPEEPSEEPEDPSEEPSEDPSEEPSEDVADTIYFNNELGGKVYTRSFENGEEVEDLPAGVNVKGYDFKGWFSKKNGKGEELENGDVWYDGMPTTY